MKYTFECKKCAIIKDIDCKISEYDKLKKAGVKCTKCKKKMERIVGTPTVVLNSNVTYNGKTKVF